MSDTLYQLVYYSRNEVSGDEADFAAQVASILEASRRNNETVGITGALLFNGGVFAQVLEGPLDAVEATFERIQQDARHGDVSLLALEPIAQRSFGNWAMGFLGQSTANAERFARVGLAGGFDPAAFDGQKVHAILRDLAIEEETLAA
ncbi:blue light sensor protein [Aureimonas sp. Leaf454]|uniref:BLUF domain-containing protein n=1 Tax=Aureimonas sp. Leaf454 TaxID=1736381 RepID=UPI0006F37A22|nr:BLUF domain-containing protein [Aureimonas sp. Leaf454]KQT50198.1 blue light sensor protein [Aureimonas sp. Leaf454]